MWVTQHDETTPITGDLAEGEVTVLDLRHPLFGCTFPLLDVMGEGEHGRYCVIRLPSGAERRIPLEATDRAANPVETYPLALNMTAVGRLLEAYARFRHQIAENDGEPKESQQAVESGEPLTVPQRDGIRARRKRPVAGQEAKRGTIEEERQSSSKPELAISQAAYQPLCGDSSKQSTPPDLQGQRGPTGGKESEPRKGRNIRLGDVQGYLGVGFRIVERLVREGWINPTVDPLDRRRKVVNTQELERLKQHWARELSES